MKNNYLAAVLLSLIVLGASAMERGEEEKKENIVAALLEAEGQESETISGSPSHVKVALRYLAKINSVEKVTALRIEKASKSARSTAENIFEPMSCQQAADKINQTYKD